MRRTLALLAAAVMAAMLLTVAQPAQLASARPTMKIAVVDSAIAKGMAGTDIAMANLMYKYTRDSLLTKFDAAEITTIYDADLRSLSTLQGYDTVVLTRQRALDTAQRVAIRDYVAQGGGLVCMFGAGRWDYTSTRNPKYYPAVYMYGSNAWEWGEISETFQVDFINDPYMGKPWSLYSPSVSTHPILAGVNADLGRGSTPLNLIARRANQSNEIIAPWKGNTNVTPLLYYRTGTQGNGSWAGWASRFYLGRVVYYGFQLFDFVQLDYGTGDPATQKEAVSLIANSALWAGTPGTYGGPTKVPVITSSPYLSGSTVRGTAKIANAGNTQLRGAFRATLIDPNGSTRSSATMKSPLALEPQQAFAYGYGLSTGTKTKGRWTLRLSYDYYDYMRGGVVVQYQDYYLNCNGSAMSRAGGGTSWSKSLPPAGGGIVGADRYAVAASISATGWSSGPGAEDAVVLATGLKFSDALAASPLAGKFDAPIMLTPRGGLSPYVVAELQRMYAGKDHAVIYAVGNDYYMPDALVAQARAVVAAAATSTAVIEVRQLEGADDFSLARRVSQETSAPTSGPFAKTAIIASYSAYADALSISPLAAKHGIPILFVTASGVPASTQAALDELGIEHCLIVGGPGTVGPGVESWLETNGYRVAGVADNDLTSPDTRLSGATRYDVSVNALKYGKALGGMDDSVLYVASGLVWPDALAAGPFGGKQSHPVLLLDGRDIGYSPPTAGYLVSRRGDVPAITFFGGPGTIREYTRGQVGRCLGLN